LPRVVSIASRVCSDLSSKGVEISRLQVDRAGTHEFAREALSGTEPGDDTTGCDALHLVFAVPGDKVAVVDVVGLTFDELDKLINMLGLKP